MNDKVNKQSEKEQIENLNVSANFAEDFAYKFANVYGKILNQMQNNTGNYLNPLWINSAMKRFQSDSKKPNEENLTKWLRDPRHHEKELMSCSYFLHDAVQHYNRSIFYLASLLSFDYELIPLNAPTIDSDIKIIQLYQKQKQKTNDWLEAFRVKEQLSNVMLDVMRTGGKCYYLRENNNRTYLQAMPDDYVAIQGRTDVLGYTYNMNMSYFYQFPESISGFAPEFADYFADFLNKKELLNDKANPWRLMPYEKSVVFKFDDTRVDLIPPLSGTMLDAVNIETYKEIARLNMELQNYTLLYLKSPLNNDGKPTVSAQEIMNYTALVQSLVNNTTAVVSSPMEAKTFDFKNSSSKDNIVGQGESLYWSSAGIAGGMFGSGAVNSIGLKYSIQADFDYVKHMYDQFERFLNYHIAQIDGKFNFKIKFIRRCTFFIDDDRKATLSACQGGLPPERLLASYGYEPYEIDGILNDSLINKTRDRMPPLQTSFTQSGNSNGRKKKDTSELTESGAETRDMESNENK